MDTLSYSRQIIQIGSQRSLWISWKGGRFCGYKPLFQCPYTSLNAGSNGKLACPWTMTASQSENLG